MAVAAAEKTLHVEMERVPEDLPPRSVVVQLHKPYLVSNFIWFKFGLVLGSLYSYRKTT